ncbi:penicillin-binding transpeptidase domain-containing protein [Enterobacillus tribolii]|uniref:Peptidoglycan D,D-transpeptidase FtsI n=1 Tax=Enterobacillus tribolii TaxID=1487935 RepID=A0A370R4Y0_9GAMM|nr:penicillin-binding transpeptidase domain-containing protein [Enterobacillus tribolii]MBW7983406.1 peptidoglycan synthase [Enterobacillus tribolii]RDK97466.1 cell division protein FtsI (penicillin-binding protein 3) [Enterobacillus tribolii]
MRKKKSSSENTYYQGRFILLYGGIFCFLLILLGRVGYLQLMRHPELEKEADQRSLRSLVTRPLRGTIADRNGQPLAVSVASNDVIADPRHILETDATLSNPQWNYLAGALSLPVEALRQKIDANAQRHFIYLARQAESGVAEYVNKLHLAGISTVPDASRYYPMSEAAADLIGIVGLDQQGLDGIEKGFNGLLQGKPGLRVYRKDGYGNVVNLMQDDPAQQAPTLNLSIDRYLQFVLYSRLRDGVLLNKADSGAAVMLNVNTGEILGMASYPAFNPNNYAGVPQKNMRNVAISDSFEPGSTVKPLVIMAGLERHLIRPDSVIDTIPYPVNGHLIRDVGHWSRLTITGILQKSSDIGVSHIALAMPANVLVNLYHAFGLGVSTGLGIGGESSGYFPLHRQRWSDIERATFSFGYGLRVTPLQMAREYATIGSFGVFRPVSITRVTPPVMGERVMNENTVRTVVHMMESDALPGGSGVKAAVPGYRLAIKTGTAEKMGDSGKYDGGYVNYTAGVAPASHPEVVLVVMINHPTAGNHFGGSVAAPVFGQIMGAALHHLNIAPDALTNQQTITLDERTPPRALSQLNARATPPLPY